MDLVVSNLAGSLADVVALARRQEPFADVLELRLDGCAEATELELESAFAGFSRPILVAVNGPEAFGTFAGDDESRLALLRRASAAGAAWIDVPWTLAPRLGPIRARRVVSRHVLDGTPTDLVGLVAEVERACEPGDRVKLVTHAACAEDGLRVLLFARERERAGRPIVAFASGAAGAFTRVLAPACGSLATYAAPARGTGGAPTAPGQIEADALRAAWPARGCTSSTRILGVVGRPVGASLSPRLHGAALRAAAIDAVYVALEPASFDAFLALATDLGVHGLSVTMPFKEDAARLASTRDAAVEACGAANTLVRGESGWHATNTDASAVRTCIGRALCDADKRMSDVVAVVVGTGGAARAALHGLRGAKLVVAGRDALKRAKLAADFDARACSIEELADVSYDVLVHTTPLGSRAHPGVLAVPAPSLRSGSIVLDAVYRPIETPLVASARAIGATVIEGRAWFLEQALAQFRAFTGVDLDSAQMRDELATALAADSGPFLDPRPIALVGLRASGKTTLGKLLAERLGRTFVDLDDEVSREDAALRGTDVLRSAGEILLAEGEPKFRDLEERALERVLSRTDSIVIATGGGVVERAKNRLLLRTRARCLWLRVPVEELQRRMHADPSLRPALIGTDAITEVATIAGRRDAWFRHLTAEEVDGTLAASRAVECCLDLLASDRK